MLRNINYFVSNFREFILVDSVSKNDGIGVEKNDSIWTTATTFVIFIAKLQVDLLKVIEFKQFGKSFFTIFILRQESVQGETCDKLLKLLKLGLWSSYCDFL